MKRLLNIFFLIIALVFAFPPFLTILDIMCWFYFSHTCTGLDYTDGRPLVAISCAFVSAVSMIITYD